MIEGCRKPKCEGCVHYGPTFPCEYILNTGHSPQYMGVRLNPYGKGGCPLKDTGTLPKKRTDPMSGRPIRMGAPTRCAVNHERALELYKHGASDAMIARELEVPPSAVYRWRKRNELEAKNLRGPSGLRRREGQSVFDAPEVMEAYRAGASDTVLARMVGCTRDAARYWRKTRGLPPNKRGST